nr:MAG TPA: hypothetical protein [Caudoviricetes sp.]
MSIVLNIVLWLLIYTCLRSIILIKNEKVMYVC